MRQPSDIEHLTDKQILEQKDSHDAETSGSCNVSRVSKNTFLKAGLTRDKEDVALRLVAAQTNIPVPQIRRIFASDAEPWVKYIAMEYIPGVPLSVAWPDMGFFQRFWVAIKIRSYVRQLRRIRPPRPGVPGELFSEDEELRKSQSSLWGLITPTRGPFDSYGALLEYLNRKNKSALQAHPPEIIPNFGIPRETEYTSQLSPLVFCHQDIVPRNIIIGEDGTIWLVDFGMAGVWPQWFEFVAVLTQNDSKYMYQGKLPSATKTADEWCAWTPLICGWDWFQYRLWCRTLITMEYDWL